MSSVFMGVVIPDERNRPVGVHFDDPNEETLRSVLMR